MKKRMIALIPAILLCISLFSVPAAADTGSDMDAEEKQSISAYENQPDPADTADTIEIEAAEAEETPKADEEGVRVVNLESGAEKGPGFTSMHKIFETPKGSFELTLCGLKEEQKEAVLKALSDYYVAADGAAPIKLVDNAFPDAEKYDSTVPGYDSGHCWAGSASNILWMTGWAERFNNPRTGTPFTSEDDIFQYYNIRFTDNGCIKTDSAVDWFFMGEFYLPLYYSSTSLNGVQETDGVRKDFVSSGMHEHFDVFKNPQQIEQLLRCDWSRDDASVFEADIGFLIGGVAYRSAHSVTIAGVITDPDAESFQEKYKAVIIIDPDNDSEPEKEEGRVENPTLEYKEAAKKTRPNSMTVYNLEYLIDKAGNPCWKIDGYGSTKESEWALFFLNRIPYYDESLINESIETEGTKSVVENVDLTLESPFTTDRETPYPDLYNVDPDEVAVKSFESGTPVNLNFFIANRSNKVIFNDEYRKDRDLTVEWKVIRDADGRVAASGKKICSGEIFENSEIGFLINLNEKSGTYTAWEPGTYTALLNLNTDRAITEAYYLNNVQKEVQFTVTGQSDISKGEISLSQKEYTYNGKTKTPSVTVTVNGQTLVKEQDYTVSYPKGRINAGKYTVTVNGKGSYKGSATATFVINRQQITPEVTLSKTSYVYNGKVKKPAVTVKYKNKKLAESDYTVTYAKGRKYPGSYKVTVTMKGSYKGNASKTFKIVPEGTSLKSLTAKKNAVTVKWKKQSVQVTGYQIAYSTSPTFASGIKYLKITDAKKTSGSIKGLKSKKRYYVKIRTYKIVNGKNYYSGWSGKKSVVVR